MDSEPPASDPPSREELLSRLAAAEAEIARLREENSALAAGPQAPSEPESESERRYRSLFENMNAGFGLFEVVSDEAGATIDLTVVAANRGFTDTTGVPLEQVVGRRLTEILPGIENDEADWIGKYARVALTGEPLQFVHSSELLGKHYSINAYQAAPRQAGVTFIDITSSVNAEEERAELERRLQQSQRIEAVGRLAGGVAHDFNNILVPIIGYVELALMRDALPQDLRADLEVVLSSAERAADLTRQILAFSRRQVLEVRVLNLNDVIEEFEPMLRRLVREDINLQTFLAPELLAIKADRPQIEQVVLNLVVNARDAMPNGGDLIVETTSVYLDDAYVKRYAESQPAGNYAMLAVSDTGHGMDDETRQRVFEPFFTTKGHGKGAGLGLATVFGIVRQHGGNIWLYSEPGRGATFKVYLPQVEEPVQDESTMTTEESPRGAETILVVEDEAMVRSLVCEALAAHGYRVIEASGPEQGLQLAREAETPPDLLLTDVVMPVMNGYQLYEQVAESIPGIKVLYVSGYTDNVIVHHGILDAGVDLLQKPFSVKGLTRKVREVIDR